MSFRIISLIFLSLVFFSSAYCNEPDIYQPVRVAVYMSPPFGYMNPDSTMGGLAVEIWEDIAHELRLDYIYFPTDMDGLLEGLLNDKYDVAVGAITITPFREEIVDFTHAVNPSGTGFAVSAESNKSAFSAYWKPILVNLLQLMGILFIGIVISGFLIWIVELNLNPRGVHERQIKGLGDSLWWAIVTMSTVGYGDKVPLSKIGKVIAIVWIFTSIILVALFTAKASSIFTVTELELQIKTESDLRKSRVGAAEKSSGEEYCIRRNIQYYQYPAVEEALDELVRGNLDAVVSNVPVIQYLKHHVYKKQIRVSRNFLLKNNMGMALPPGSHLKEPINRVLLQKVSEPKWRATLEKYLGEY